MFNYSFSIFDSLSAVVVSAWSRSRRLQVDLEVGADAHFQVGISEWPSVDVIDRIQGDSIGASRLPQIDNFTVS